MNSAQNIRVGPCRVRFAGRDLGLTKGGVDLEMKTETKMVNVDQFGNSALDEWITGRTLTVKTPFAETDLDSISFALKKAQTAMVLGNSGTGASATGTITFTAAAVANDTVTINGVVYEFMTAPTVPAVGEQLGTAASPVQVLLGSTPDDCAANLLQALQVSSSPLVLQGVYSIASASPTIINVVYYRAGVSGNSFTLAASDTTKITIAGSTLTGGTDAPSRRLEIYTGVGQSLFYQNGTTLIAAQLELHPYSRPDNDYAEDIVVPFANTSGNFTLNYRFDAERTFSLSFTGYPDPVSTRLMYYGNRN